MSDYDAIIRFRKWELDGLRRELSDLDARCQEVEDLIREQDEFVEAERSAETDVMVGMNYGAFAQAALERRAQYLVILEDRNAELEEKREVVREAFQEMKKIEVARDRALAAAVAKENRYEQTELDEIALQKHTRKLSGADF